MLQETQDETEIIARIAALDIGKAEVVCCARVPGPGGKRAQEVTAYSTMTRSLQLLADRLRELNVTRVIMEATSDYWRPPFYLLEANGFEVWLVNARDVKHLPGRPKADRRLSGCARSPSGAWSARVSCRRPRSGSYGT